MYPRKQGFIKKPRGPTSDTTHKCFPLSARQLHVSRESATTAGQNRMLPSTGRSFRDCVQGGMQ